MYNQQRTINNVTNH